MLADSHTHSCFSFDGAEEATPDALCRAAIERGITHLTVTDHYDVDGDVEGIYRPFEKERCYEALSEAKERYRGSLTLLVGIELGQPYAYPEIARELLEKHSYDFVLGSVHNLPAVPDFSFLRYEEMPDRLIESLYDRTLDEEMRLCSFPGVNALAHITYMHRYVTLAGRSLNFTRYRDKLVCLFNEMKRRDVALELNVSLLRKGLPVWMPTEEILTLYRDSGGKLLTVGSDAHTPRDLGANIRDGYRLLRSLGFESVAVYEKGRPTLYPLDT